MAENNSSNHQATQYNAITGGVSNTLNNVAPSATSGVALISQGVASQPIFGTVVVAGGGTGSTSFTAGSVVFSNGTILTQDNANLFYDDTNNRLGLGITTPLDTLHVVGAMELDHTATANDDHAIEIVCNANGFSDVKAMDIDYITGALGAGQDEEAILVNIDQSASTGGIVAGYLCLTTSTGSAVVNGYETGININPIVHESGTFGNADSILNVAVDVTAALASGGAGAISAFLLDNSTMTIGDAAQFGEMEIILTTPASGAGIDPLFEYSTGAATFAAFVPADGTNGLRNTGAILWDASTLAGWVVAASGRYEIRITRQRNSLSTTPVLDELQIAALTEYKWDKDGNVNLKSLALTSPLTAANGGTGRSTLTVNAVLTGNGTSVVGMTNTATNGQILIGKTAAIPAFATVTSSDSSITFTPGANTLSMQVAGYSGLVVGPASATDNALCRFDNTTGKLIQNGVITEDDTGNLSIAAAVSGGNLSAIVSNTSNTASAQAFYQAQVAGGTAADAYYVANISGGQGYSWGVDNSDSDAFVLSATVTPGTTNVMRVSTAGEIIYPLQPSFLAYLGTTDSNVTGDGTVFTLGSGNALTEVFDQNNDFVTTGTFTAPVTGRYNFNFSAQPDGVGVSTGIQMTINTSNSEYFILLANPVNMNSASFGLLSCGSIFCDMDAADTTTFRFRIGETTKTLGVLGIRSRTYVSGALIN